MKSLLLSVLTIIVLTAPLHAQQTQPPPPPDTVFPLGGFVNGLGGNTITELPQFGLNMLYNGGLPLGPGQGAVVDVGSTQTNGVSVDNFFPNGAQLGFNPYFLETDIDLVSNESGDGTWDLNNCWAEWDPKKPYLQCSAVYSGGSEWACIQPNTNQNPQTTTGFWIQAPGQWASQNYTHGQYVWDKNPASGQGELLWVCTTNEAAPQEPPGSDWCQPVWVDNPATNPPTTSCNPNDGSYNTGDAVYFYNNRKTPEPITPALPFPNTPWVCTGANLGQPPSSNHANLSWTQLVTKTGSKFTTSPDEWHISQSDNNGTGVYLDYNFYANGPLANGSGDFLGGGSTVYLDFISRLDPSNGHYTDLGSTPNDVPLYEIDATADVTEVGSYTINDVTTMINKVQQVPLTTQTPGTSPTDITYGDYSNYLTQSGYGANHWGNYAGADPTNSPKAENPNIINFPNTSLQRNPKSTNPYSVFRLACQVTSGTSVNIAGNSGFDSSGAIFDISGPHQTQVGTTTTSISSIHFTLKSTAKSEGIFVRGVRLRTAGADWLYRGKLDLANSNVWGPQWAWVSNGNGGLTLQDNNFTNKYHWPGFDALFQGMRDKILEYGSSTAWNQFIGSQSGNECDWPSFRLYAYLNELWRAWTKEPHNGGEQKNLYQIYTSAGNGDETGHGNLSYYRSIYEDQSGGVPPPPYQSETIQLGNSATGDHDFAPYTDPYGNVQSPLLFPGDAIPAEVKNHSGFLEFALGITGWDGTSSYGATATTSSDDNNYQTYTTRYQSAADGISSFNQTCAENCYPQAQQPSVWTPFYFYPSIFADQWPTGFRGSSGIAQYLDNSALAALPQGSSVTYSELQTAYGPNGYLLKNTFPSSPTFESYFNFVSHPPTPAEIREETWDGITWGAKGIIYNPIGTDGGQDIGLCGSNWESSVNSGFPSAGLPNVANDDLINNPPGVPSGGEAAPWSETSAYGRGAWVSNGGSNWVCILPVPAPNQGNNNPAPPNSSWASQTAGINFSEVKIFNTNSSGDYWWGVPVTGIPGYYGMKDRSEGVKRAMADIDPIAWELKQLQWVTSFDYSDNGNLAWASGTITDGNHPTGFPEFPFTIVSSEHVYDPGTPPVGTNAYHSGGFAPLWSPSSAYSIGNFVEDAAGSYWICSQTVTATPNPPGNPAPASSPTFWAKNGSGEFRFKTNGETDETNTEPLYYNIGVFNDPNDPGAFYTTIANRRTWPMLLDAMDNLDPKGNPTSFSVTDNSGNPSNPTIDLLGAIDARRIDLKLKSGTDIWVDKNNNSVPSTWSSNGVNWYTITNMRTGWDTTGSTTNLSTVSLDLDPGEGTLLRVAPTTAVEVGRTNSMAYNNGHRVAILSASCTPLPDHGVVWEENGQIGSAMYRAV